MLLVDLVRSGGVGRRGCLFREGDARWGMMGWRGNGEGRVAAAPKHAACAGVCRVARHVFCLFACMHTHVLSWSASDCWCGDENKGGRQGRAGEWNDAVSGPGVWCSCCVADRRRPGAARAATVAYCMNVVCRARLVRRDKAVSRVACRGVAVRVARRTSRAS